MKSFRSMISLSAWLYVTVLGVPTTHAAGPLAIDNNTLILVDSSRVSRTEFDLTYRANVTNRGATDIAAVTAALTSLSPHVRVINGTVTFGTVPAGTTATSSNTFTIRQDRLFPFDPTTLVWTIAESSGLENFYVIKAREDAKFEALRNELGDDFREEEGTGFGAYQNWVGYWQQKLYPHGVFEIAYDAMNQVPPASFLFGACTGWRELGPFDMPLPTNFLQPGCPPDVRSRGIGRITWITFDPANADNMFVGSPYAGLFYSTDAGANWQSGGTDFLMPNKTGGTAFMPNIGAAHVAVDPTNGFRWFLASGDGDGLKDLSHDNGENISHGVYRTLNKGLTWQGIGLDYSGTHSFQIKKLVIAPNNPNKIYAATSRGLYSTQNALDPDPAAVTWSLEPTGGDQFYDIAYEPNSTSAIYAAGVSIQPFGVSLVRTVDGGLTWNLVPGIPFLSNSNVVRMAMEVTPAKPEYVYVVVVTKEPAACNGIFWTDAQGVQHPIPSSWLYLFDASDDSWTDKGPICNTGSYSADQRGVHFSRGHSIGVSPIDADLIYIADIQPIVKCISGADKSFCNWLTLQNAVHDDIHQIRFTPNGQTMYAATDGGVYKSVDQGATWTPQSKGLRVGKVLRMSTSATNPELIMGGHFDTGTMLYNDNAGTWTHALCGDGLTPMTDPPYMFASAQGGFMYRSNDQGFKFTSNVSLPCPNWFTFAVLNSVDTNTVFGACHPEVVRSITRGGNWVPISNFASVFAAFSGPTINEAFKIYTAPSAPDYLYVHLTEGTATDANGKKVYGTPHVMRTKNANDPTPANVKWVEILPPSLPTWTQWISDIDVDENNPDNFWLTLNGMDPSTASEKVFYYDGNSTKWTNLTTNLAAANLGVQSIVHERGSNRLFIGTTLGVYTGSGLSPNWTRVGGATDGELPYIEVEDVEINYVNDKLLRANTRGRGTWEISLNTCQATSCVNPPASITNWWPFDETTGTMAHDIVGGSIGTYGSFPASPTPVAGRVAAALSFASSNYLTIADAPTLNLTHGAVGCSGYTIDAWVKTKQDTGVVAILDKRTNSSAPVGYHLFLSEGKLGLQLADGMPAGKGCGPETTNPCTNYGGQPPGVADGAWHHIAATVQVHGTQSACPEVGNLYVDGNVVLTFFPRTHSTAGNLPGSDIANTADLYIGRRDPAFSGPGNDGFFNGIIDELEFFRTVDEAGLRSSGALTQPEIQTIYNAGSAGKCKPMCPLCTLK